MPCKERLEAYLHEQQVPFQVQQHSIAFTAQDVAACEHLPGKLIAKAVLVFADAKMVLLVLPASYRVNLSQAARLMGVAEVRLADEVELGLAFPDCEVGAMPPFGNLYHLPVYVDESLAEDNAIVFPVGTHTQTMRLAYADFERLVRPVHAAFAYPVHAVLQ